MPRDLALVLVLRLWQAGAGLVTTVLAVHFLSAELQGWYYSFLSVAALYTLFDLGLSTVLVQVSAHTFVGSRWSDHGGIEGGAAHHFEALVGHAARWYAAGAVLFAALLVPAGLLFFGAKHATIPHWAFQWLVLCGLTAAGLLVMPFLSILEGTGRIVEVYALRLVTVVSGSIGCWLLLANGGMLWATALAPAMAFAVPAVWLVSRRPRLLTTAMHGSREHFHWQREVWPLQWRLAINWMSGYLLTQIDIPILFHSQGAVIAGQFGLSLTIANTLSLVSQSWLTRRVPAMARAAAERDWPTLDKLFSRDFAISSAVFVAGAAAVVLLYLLLAHTVYVHRVLPLWQLAALLGFTFSNQLIGALSTHLRSYRKEPLMPLIATTTLITLPALVWAAHAYSSAGLVTVLAIVNILLNLPAATLVWLSCNRAWRRED